MATISREEWNKYIALLRKTNEKAAMDIVTFMRNHLLHGSDAIETLTEAQRKELIDYAYAIVQKYGEATAALSAEMYDAVAILEGRYVAPAEMAELASYGDVAKAVNGTLLQSGNLEEIASAASRWVKMAGADTTMHNAIRDGAEFAWIPSGETCPFCIALASRGWQYASKKAVKNGHAEHIHSNCDCQYTVRFNERTTVEGYDPDAYLSMYQHADGRTPTERINSMRRTAYAADKESQGTDNQGLIDVN
jgi:hypothetical protein